MLQNEHYREYLHNFAETQIAKNLDVQIETGGITKLEIFHP